MLKEQKIKKYYAKSKLSNGCQPTVKEHLSAVAELAELYGNEFGRGKEAKTAGLFHDFGKYLKTIPKPCTPHQSPLA